MSLQFFAIIIFVIMIDSIEIFLLFPKKVDFQGNAARLNHAQADR